MLPSDDRLLQGHGRGGSDGDGGGDGFDGDTASPQSRRTSARATRVATADEERATVVATLALIVLLVVLALVVLDAFTTHFLKRAFLALREWASYNRPWSYGVIAALIVTVYVCCLPFGPLVFTLAFLLAQEYGKSTGILLAGTGGFGTT